MTRLPAPAIALALLLSAGAALLEATAADEPGFAVTVEVDRSAFPLLKVVLHNVSSDTLLESLSGSFGFAWERIGTADPRVKLSGHYEGRLEDLLPWLLRYENYAIVRRPAGRDGESDIVRILLFDSRSDADALLAESAPAPRPSARDAAERLAALRALAGRGGLPADFRAWLDGQIAAAADPARPAGDVLVNLYDLPASLDDALARLQEPLAGDYDDIRLENRPGGAPPRHLTGANDAAQQNLAEALARVTAMARQNLAAGKEALDRACPFSHCPGITAEEIADRDATAAQAAEQPKE